MSEEEQTKGFQVRDRRRFDASGAPREEANGDDVVRTDDGTEGEAAPAETARPTRDDEPAAKDSRDRADSRRDPERESRHAVEITLSTFLVSLSTQALMLLGEIPNPADGKTETDLVGAEELISLITMLRQKTRGNLDEGETKLIEQILYDLRMHYVSKAQGR